MCLINEDDIVSFVEFIKFFKITACNKIWNQRATFRTRSGGCEFLKNSIFVARIAIISAERYLEIIGGIRVIKFDIRDKFALAVVAILKKFYIGS